MRLFRLFLFLLFLAQLSVYGQAPGSLDASFGTGGITTVSGGNEYTECVAIQPDGKIVAGGSLSFSGTVDFFMIRYNSDGTVDNTFGVAGKVVTHINAGDAINGLAIQPDGKIIAAGYSNSSVSYTAQLTIVRYNTNGTLDNTFSGDGIALDPTGAGSEAKCVSLQSDGKIIAGGYHYVNGNNIAQLVRLNTDGTFDTSFSGDGVALTPWASSNSYILSICELSSGQIAVCGSAQGSGYFDIAVARYNGDGTLDNTFGSGGVRLTIFPYQSNARSIAVQSDGKLIVVGGKWSVSACEYIILRYTTSGNLDPTYGTGGMQISALQTTSEANSVVIQPDDRAVVTGVTYDPLNITKFNVVRYTTTGVLDTGFGTGGIVYTPISVSDRSYAAALQPDGKIVVVGIDQNGLSDYVTAVRYHGGNNCQPSQALLTESTCSSYTLNGQTYTSSGTYVQTLINSGGCDSLLTLELTINQPTTATITESSCSAYSLNGQTYISSGTYIQTLTSSGGCDSLLTLELTINQPTTGVLSDTACGSLFYNAQTFTESGTYQQQLVNAQGCDSILTLHLTILPVPAPVINFLDEITLQASIPGAVYQWINCTINQPVVGEIAQTFIPSVNGIYTVSVTTANGCSERATCVEVLDVGIGENTLLQSVRLYPNPTTETIFIELPEEIASVSITDIHGAIHTGLDHPDTPTVALTIPGATGIYFCRIVAMNGEMAVVKVVKK